jgi:hypothetical protein
VAQGSSGAQARPETKPLGSANVAIAIEGDGFWMVYAVDPPTDHRWPRNANGYAHDDADLEDFLVGRTRPITGRG